MHRQICLPMFRPTVRARALSRTSFMATCAMVFFTGAGVPTWALAAPAQLYERLGSGPVISELADAFVDYISMDPRTAHHFDGAPAQSLKQSIGSQLCAISDGPCAGAGTPSMKGFAGSGTERSATIDEVNILNEYLSQAMQAHHVDAAAQSELLMRLNAPHLELVEK